MCVCVAQGLRAVCKYTPYIHTHTYIHTYIHTNIHIHVHTYTIQLQPPQKKAKRYMYVNCIYIIYMYVHCAYSCTHNFVDEYIYSVIIISYSAQVTQTTPKQNTGT